MKVTLYWNKSTYNTLDKTLAGAKSFSNVKFFKPDFLDVSKPEILLQITDSVSDFVKYNYCYIPDLKRYYYIDNISTEGGLVKISCRTDVLMSFKSDIKKSKQYVIRSQSKNPSPYLEDNLLPIKSKHNYISKSFGEYVDDTECGYVILATSGDGGTVV